MSRERPGPKFLDLAIYGAAIAILLVGMPYALASEQPIDLDENLTNGEESIVRTKVLGTSPVVIENVIFNNTDGQSFRFYWRGAGPAGFNSQLTPGPDIGTKWTWSTVSQVFTITTPVNFVENSHEITAFGGTTQGIQDDAFFDQGLVFEVPGKSIFPTEVTLPTDLR